MKNLDYNRCLQVVKWNIIANKKNLINTTVALAAITFVVHCLNTGLLWMEDIDTVQIASTSNVLMTLGAIYILIKAARINFNMQNKGDIINYAMLPATKLEKFCTNWFMQVPLLFVMLFAGLFIGDVFQMIICLILHGNCYSIMIQMINDSLPTFVIQHAPSLAAVCWFLGVVIFHATFLYGGVFFRRHPILFTVLCWIAFPMVIGAVVTAIGEAIAYCFFNTSYDVTIEWLLSVDTMKTIAGICFLLFEIGIIALLYWLTYRKFCRTQVINNKFYN